MNRRPTTSRKSTGISMAVMQARVAASLSMTKLTAPTTYACITSTPELPGVVVEEKFYADQRLMFRT